MLIFYLSILGPQVYFILSDILYILPCFAHVSQRMVWPTYKFSSNFQDTNAALGLSALLHARGRLVIWRDLVGARVHCQRS